MKRIALYLATNLGVLVLITIVVRALGLERFLGERGLDLSSLLAMAAVLGFAGSLVSLALSKWTARHLLGVELIAESSSPEEAWLLGAVGELARRAGIGMPEVGVFDSSQMNAFATGARRDHALVAVSRGLLEAMTPEEAAAVLGHEVTHVANGDMVTLALVQGVLNTFVIFLSRVLAALLEGAVGQSREERRRGGGALYFAFVVAFEMALGLIASLIVMAFSRRREFRADGGGARLAGRENMIAALERLAGARGAALPGQMAAFGISGRFGTGIERLFMSHPPIDERIAALRAGRFA